MGFEIFFLVREKGGFFMADVASRQWGKWLGAENGPDLKWPILIVSQSTPEVGRHWPR